MTAAFVAGAAETKLRTWTDVQLRKVEAEFVGESGGNVTLRLADGKPLTVPLASLSATDREWIKVAQAGGGETDVALSEDTRPPASAEWPRTVSIKGTPEVTVIEEDATERRFVYETEHYEFVCDSRLGAALVREFARVFEGTWLVNCLLPLDLKPQPEPERKKFRAQIFTKEEDYLKLGGTPGSAGVYSPRANALMLPLASLGVRMVGSRVSIDYQNENYRTLIHEITHQMMNHWLSRLPVWFIEGSAEYVELADYDGGRFSFTRQDQQLRQHVARMTGGSFEMTPLRWLLDVGHQEWSANLGPGGQAWRNYLSALLLTYFFYHLDGDGKGTHMIAFMRDVEKLPPGGDYRPALETHLVRGRTMEQLQDELRKAFRREQVTVTFPDLAKAR